jgi:PHP family Zn ribbon phosphoesterase
VNMSEPNLLAHLPRRVAEGIIRVRAKDLAINPGFDGEYGTIQIFSPQPENQMVSGQMSLF